MITMEQLKVIGVLGPIFVLLALGFGLTLRSGVMNLSSGQGLRQAAENFSQTVLMVAGVLVVLLILQEVAGFGRQLGW
jgi:hypothetical protein